MKKKFVMAVAAVAMAAVVGVSAFAATGTAYASITGDAATGTSFVAPSSEQASETTKQVYETIVATEGTTEEKLAAVVSQEKVAEAVATAGVQSAEDLTIRAVGDVTVSAETGEVAMTVAGLKEGDTAVVMYQDANGNWVPVQAVVINGKLVFKLPKSGTIILLTKKAA